MEDILWAKKALATSFESSALQTFVLGMTLVIIGLLSDSIYAIIGGGLGDLFRRRPGAARATRLTAGFTYVALAGIAAVAGGRTK